MELKDIELGEFRGHPTLGLNLESESGFKNNIRYGLSKWKVIMENKDKIEAWIAEQEAKKTETKQAVRDSVKEAFGSK